MSTGVNARALLDNTDDLCQEIKVLDSVIMTPTEFEQEVATIIRGAGGTLSEFNVQHQETISAADGEYTIDVTARFNAFGGADFLTLIECKMHKNPIKREVVQTLYAKVQSVGAHKGILFATTSFQSGAIKYAKSHGIALVQIADGKTMWIQRAYTTDDERPSWIPRFACWLYIDDENPPAMRVLDQPGPLLEILERQ